MHEKITCFEDEDPPPKKKWVMNVKKQRGRKRRIVHWFKTSRLLSPLRHIKVRSSSRWDGVRWGVGVGGGLGEQLIHVTEKRGREVWRDG